MKRYRKTVVILAGGQGSRMGYRDKAFLRYGGTPFIEHLLKKVEAFAEVIVVSNNPGEYRNYPVKVVEDKVKGIGPLGGIYTGLLHSTHEEILVISCDTPFQREEFLEYMGGLSGSYDAAIPKHREGREPLCALYRRSLLRGIEELIEEKRYKIALLFEKNRVEWVDIESMTKGIEIVKGFKNINTPEELREVGGEYEK
ncbi:hypothetical protein PM10SUCC1_08020 [Propionigenium maris DSM 9537]|uniref:Probable molybdenum cofactor guanylyltransferase n=1 Tax=Propionigenium maris DSM 9537 TaxID=1123000 RepID=A0A9W6GJD2_9FUSO|nr:molybdenum cofactor guanylyltransferase [Propionigenium maris]GLI55288.1 hypothetical protein PM10SUCC1_08020 [Propionigenium maris DSM 9537]